MAPRLPADIVEKLDMWGRFRFDPHGADIDVSEIGTLEHDMWELAQADSDAFVSSIAAAVLPRGGWAVYGGAHMVMSVIGGAPNHPAFDELMAASLEVLIASGAPTVHLNPYELDFLAARVAD
jgi:hypothetical protein